MDKYNELLEDLKNAYDSKVLERNESILAPWKEKERDRFLSEIKQGGKKRLLEIGCGTGRDSLFFKSKGFEVVCTDLSPGNIELCRENGLDAQVMDFLNLDFPTSSFDAIFAQNCLLHAPKNLLGKILCNIARLLRPSGLFFLGVYGGLDKEGVLAEDNYEPKRFFSSYTDIQIIQIVSKIFKLVYFHRVELEPENPVHFQSMILKPKTEQID